jgi:hypothetical protein
MFQAFMTFNRAFDVIWAGHWMHLNHADALARAIASYHPKTSAPSSFWIRRIA